MVLSRRFKDTVQISIYHSGTKSLLQIVLARVGPDTRVMAIRFESAL